MTDTPQLHTYRQRIYDTYLSLRFSTDHKSIVTDADATRSWINATHSRVRGWLPTDLATPILDMGCGSGRLIGLLRQIGYTHCMGVDVSPEQIVLAQQCYPDVQFIHGDLHSVLAAYPGHFGLITGFDILEHFGKEELFPLLELIVRALRSDGRIIVQTPNAESPWFGAVAYGDFTHEWFFTPRSLEEILRRVGMTNFKARPSMPVCHGLKSAGRSLLWAVIQRLLLLWNVAEIGKPGSGIYTRVFLATAVKP